MINDAEKFKAEDETEKERITAKNALESYACNMKSIAEDELRTITDKCNEVGRQLCISTCNPSTHQILGVTLRI